MTVHVTAKNATVEIVRVALATCDVVTYIHRKAECDRATLDGYMAEIERMSWDLHMSWCMACRARMWGLQ